MLKNYTKTDKNKKEIVHLLIAGILAILLIASMAWGFNRIVSAYDDIDGSIFENQILALKDLDGVNVFEGTEAEGADCNEASNNFCSAELLKRWQGATWLVRSYGSINNEAFDDGTPADDVFDDVDVDEWWAPYVNRAKELGITVGCGGGTGFCPDDNMTRAQWATMLVRTFDELEAVEIDHDGFSDVDATNNASHHDNILKIATVGITNGCGDGTGYCPGNSITRGQAAALLARTIDWLSPDDDEQNDDDPGDGGSKPDEEDGSGDKGGKPGTTPDTGIEDNILFSSLVVLAVIGSATGAKIWYDTRKNRQAKSRL